MANTFAPNGFDPAGRFDGASWSANLSSYLIAYNNAHKIYQGDPVTLLSTGFVDTLAPGSISSTVMPCGIFMGCSYISASQQRLVWSPFFPAGDTLTNGTVTAFLVDDPNVSFAVQTGWSAGVPAAATQAMVGMNATYAYGTASYANISGAYIDLNTTPAVTASLPFRITGLITDPPGVNGTDTTTAYNKIMVMWNNQFLRQLTGV